MRSVKLEDLKNQIENLFEETIDEVESAMETEQIEESTASPQNTQDNMEAVVSVDDTSMPAMGDTENSLFDLDTIEVEDIFSEDNQTEQNTNIEEKETEKPSSKFKSVEDLEKAYNSLEKEFTKRCQRLKQLEKELSAQNADTPEQWKAKVDKFFSETPEAKPFAREMAEVISLDTALRGRKDCLETALNRVLMKKYRSPRDLATDEVFLREHILGSDFVKKAVIDGYMKDLREGKPPVLISRAGQNTVAPRNKPKTIRDAGILFQQNNK